MFTTKDFEVARAIKPGINLARLDPSAYAWLKIAQNANDSSTVYDATISNGIAYFDRVSVSQPLVSLKLTIPITQTGSGTPSPTNIRDFVGVSGVNVSRTGVNVWDEEWEVGGLMWATGLPFAATDRFRSKNFSTVTPSTNYYAKTSGLSELVVFAYDKNKEFISYERGIYNRIFTTPSNARFIKIVSLDTSTTYNHDISINYPSTDTSYHAYTGNTYQISFGQTVYSAILDVLTGELSLTHGIVDLGDLEWNLVPGATRFYTDNINDISLEADFTDMFCSGYNVISSAVSFSNMPDKSIKRGGSNSNISIRDLDYTDADNFTTAVTGMKLVYKLAEPIEIDLTPTQITTLIGENVIFADVANVTECKYTRK